MKKLLLRGGVLLGISALISKILGLWRDRLVVDIFAPETTDLIYAAFRIPDFFYYLLVGATVSVIFLPKLVELNEREKTEYMASFLWGVLLLFGTLSLAGFIGADKLSQLFAAGLPPESQNQVASLARFLFGSVFILALSSVFASRLQSQQKFIAIAVAPLLYMGSTALSLFIFKDTLGVLIIGYGAILGAATHLVITGCTYFLQGGRLVLAWQRPAKAWKNFWPDFSRRVFNNAAFQINQSVDVWIASFLLVGSITAFSLGTTLGHFLLSIVGFSVMNAAFPKLTAAKHNYPAQKQILKKSIGWIWGISIPLSILCIFFTGPILQLLFNLTGERLEMTQTVFFWTVLSLPFACILPVCSRLFLANDDTLTPLYATITTLTVATGVAAYLSLVYFPPEKAILGLALGNFTANTLGFVLFISLIWWKYERKMKNV